MTDKRYQRGFTLMEMLIVVAIVAILVAISIPIFSSRLETVRETADLANVRSAYAELLYKVLDESEEPEPITVELTQRKSDWQTSLPITIGDVTYNGESTANWRGTPGSRGTCEVSYDSGKGIIFTWRGSSVYTGSLGKAKADLRGVYSSRNDKNMQSNYAFYSNYEITVDGKTVKVRIYYAGSAAYKKVLAGYTPTPATYEQSPFYDVQDKTRPTTETKYGFAYYTYAENGSIGEFVYVSPEKVYRTTDEGETWYDITPVS